MGMPSRQISPQSFDEILTELGDDPAIPDPHGIRKSGSPKTQPKAQVPSQIPSVADLKKIGILIAVVVGLIGLGIVLFTAYGSSQASEESSLAMTQNQISELKKELANVREEILVIEDELYDAFDLLEVSIHSLNHNKPSITTKPKPQTIPFEAELRRWRYLGLSQIGSSQRAFFHNGKGTVMLEKGSLALGDWRLSQLDKELAILTHSQGKSFTLKPAKTE